MSTGPLPRQRVFRRLALVLAQTAVVVLISGCGGQEEAEAPAQTSLPGLVPARADSTASDTMAAARDDIREPGTSPAAGVQDPVAVDKATLRPTAQEAPTDPATAAKSVAHRPQVRAGAGDFGLQLGSFRSAANARAQADRLRELGYEPALEVASLGGQTYHRVVLRGLPDRAEAERLGEHIRSQLGITYLIRQK